MAKPLETLDWSLVETFLLVAETGSFSAAARRLSASQPTIGRRIRDMEEALGAPLFTRQPRGMVPTETAAALLAPARAMREAAGQFALLAAGSDEALTGTVRVTASLIASHHVLPPILATLRRDLPEVEIELVPSDTSENLLFREADIAVRMYRPTQLDMVTRHVGEVPLGLFGARAYLDRVGRPTSTEEVMALDWVGYDRNEEIVTGFRAAGFDVDRHFFRTRCDVQTAYWELVRAGCGLGFGAKIVAAADDSIEEVALGVPIPSLPVWLTAHEAVRRTPRVRAVWHALARGLEARLS